MDNDSRTMPRKKYKKFAQYSGKRLIWLAEQYIEDCLGCRSDENEENEKDQKDEKDDVKCKGKRKREKFPNMAGFCRFIEISPRRYSELCELYPEETGLIAAAFEDEALNSNKPAAIIAAYLKARLGYAENAPPKNDGGSGAVNVIFEHDIISDGE
jgi:hypothetical protein